VVSLIGLPANLAPLEQWHKANGPKLALLLPDLRLLGDRAAIREAFKSGKITAAVLNKPGAPAESTKLGGNLKLEFEQRFILLSPANIDSLQKAFPQLF